MDLDKEYTMADGSKADILVMVDMEPEWAANRIQAGEKAIESNKMLIEVVKVAYRKHHLGDDSIGWDELSDALQNALCNVMGDDKFTGWLSQIREMWYQRE